MPHVRFAYEPQANIIFIRLSRAVHQKATQALADYSLRNSDLDNGPANYILTARFVYDSSKKKPDLKVSGYYAGYLRPSFGSLTLGKIAELKPLRNPNWQR